MFGLGLIRLAANAVQLLEDQPAVAEPGGRQAVEQLQVRDIDFAFLRAPDHERIVHLAPGAAAKTQQRTAAVADGALGQ